MKTNTNTSQTENYIVEVDGEPLTRLNFQADGKADLSTGYLVDAIRYTEQEAAEVAFSIGDRAEAVKL